MAKRKNTSNKKGEKFEKLVQDVCNELKLKGIAHIDKVPTEVKVIRIGKKIVNAFFVQSSKFVDFCGFTNKGEYIAIEAKTTTNKTSFSFANIQNTQFEYFIDFYKMNCKHGYYLIRFDNLKELYFVQACEVQAFKDNNTRKSIPIVWFRKNAQLLDYDKINFIDYMN